MTDERIEQFYQYKYYALQHFDCLLWSIEAMLEAVPERPKAEADIDRFMEYVKDTGNTRDGIDEALQRLANDSQHQLYTFALELHKMRDELLLKDWQSCNPVQRGRLPDGSKPRVSFRDPTKAQPHPNAS